MPHRATTAVASVVGIVVPIVAAFEVGIDDTITTRRRRTRATDAHAGDPSARCTGGADAIGIWDVSNPARLDARVDGAGIGVVDGRRIARDTNACAARSLAGTCAEAGALAVGCAVSTRKTACRRVAIFPTGTAIMINFHRTGGHRFDALKRCAVR